MKLRSVRAFRGMVAAGHPLAASEGLAVLRAGGNATDAAIAAAAVLAVVSPHECGLGGDLLSIFHQAGSGEVMALNASGRSPAAATLQAYAEGVPMIGGLSVSVPGMVGGWTAAVERYGSMSLERLLAPAIALAEEGFPAYDMLIENSVEKREAIATDVNTSAAFFPGGKPLVEGARIVQAATGRTLRKIASTGAAGFYHGEVARAMAGYVQAAGGLLTEADLNAFEPLWQPVVEAPFKGYRVCTMPPNSWAAALLVQLMAMERDGVAASSGDCVDFIVQGIRTRREAYAALAGTVADPDAVGDKARDVIAGIIAEGALGASAALRAAATSIDEPGPQGTDTSNVMVVDADGNSVSLLQSVFVPFGSGLYEPTAGVLFNNRMRGFGTDAGHPNVVAPSKRPAQTLTPVLVLDGDRTYMACSTPGGPGQTGTVAQFLARVLANGESMAEAIAAPRWSMTLVGDFILEDTTSAALRASVLAAEPAVKVTPWGSVNFGSMVAIQRSGDGWIGCVDARRNAAVVGY